MKYYNIFSGWLLILVLTSICAFSVGVFENGDYFYYTNKAEPIVDINISAGSTPIKVRDAVLTIGEQEFNYGEGTTVINMFTSKVFSFDLDKDISNIDDARFKLLVYNVGETKLIKPQGDPVDFYFKYDNVSPKMLAFSNDIAEDGKMIFEFNEPINEVKVTVDGKTFTGKNVVNNYVLDDREVEVYFDGFSFGDKAYDIEIEFDDLAGNVGEDSATIIVSSKPFQAELLTLQNDSSLVYNFDKKYKDLFDGKIYTSSNNFQLKVKTNKPAICYFSSSLLSFKELDEVNDNSKSNFSTTNDLIHTYQVTELDDRIWIACQNKYVDSEVVYLEDYFDKQLIDVEVYKGDDLEILMAEPTSLVTNNPFSLFLKTNEKAICFYDFDSSRKEELNTTDFINFETLDVSKTGKHTLKFECLDVMANKATKSYNINVDESQGIKVTSYSPKYTMSSTTSVEISLSQTGDVDCKYSKTQVPITKFSNLTAISGIGIRRTFTSPSLEAGKNDIFIYCSYDGQVSKDEITITYDNKGITISNFTFINGDYESENYIGSTSEIEFEFDVDSLIPIEEYVATFTMNNESMVKKFSKPKATIKGDFSDVSKIKIYAINKLDVNKSYEKNIKYDGTAPMITVNDISGGKKIVCTDLESGCAAIFYGFAQTNIDCHANAYYDGVNDSILDVSGKNYLCVNAYNKAGLMASKIEDVHSINASSGGNIFINDTFINDENKTSNTGSEDNNINDTLDPEFGVTPNDNPDDPNNTFIIVAAIVLLLAGTGGGGYYAYSKGYLDKELEKLGIHVPARKNNDTQQSSGAKFTTKPIQNEVPSKNLKKSSYDSHLGKLKKFIDDKISGSSDMFDKFDESNKGKVKGYQDTLIHNQKKKGDLSKEDFDEFYAKSGKSSTDVTARESLEKEAESFEKYYKKKKDTTKDSKNKKK